MKLSQRELSHLIFLSEVVLDSNKRSVMPEAMQCLLYVVKSMEEVELPDEVAADIRDLLVRVEKQLRKDNERLQEIRNNLDQFNRRNPFG